MNQAIRIFCFSVCSTILGISFLEAQNILPSSSNPAKDKWKADRENVRRGQEKQKRPSEILEESIKDPALASIPSQSKNPLIKNTQAIVLVANEEQLHKSAYKELHGIYVYEVDFPGRQKEIEKRLRKYLGRPLSLYDIAAIKREIATYYKEKGRPVVVVQIPEQDITEGIVQVLVTEAKLGKIEVKGNKHFTSSRIEEYCKLKSGQPVEENILVENLSFMNRNPFRKTDAVYTPGEKSGTTDIELITKDRRPLRVYAGVDNTGMQNTGETRWFGGFNWGNAFGLDHQLSYQYTTSTDLEKFQAHTVNYGIPFSWQHMLTLYGGYSTVDVNLEGRNGSGKSKGHAYQASMRYDIPLPLYKRYLHEFTWGGDFKRTNNNLEFVEADSDMVGSNVNLTQLAFGYNGGLELARSKTFFEANFFYSPGSWIGDQSAKDYSTLREGAKPKYAYLWCSLAHIHHLSNNMSFSLLFRGQAASTELLPSEQLGLGGYNTVRGYEEREVNTDNGILLNGEVRSPPIRIARYFGNHHLKDGLQFLGFVDYGLGKNYNSLPDLPSHQWLMGIGPGVRYSVDPYLSIRLDYGFKINLEKYQGGMGKLHFAVIASY